MKDEQPQPAGPVAEGGSPAHPPESPPSAPPTGEEQVQEDLDALLSEAERQRDEYLDLAKRTKADFENFRKRMSAEVQAAAGRGKAELVRELIDPLDNLERALHAVGIDADKGEPLVEEGEETNDKVLGGFEHGVLLVFHSLRETLLRNGIEPVDPLGEKFDPNLHEALSTEQVVGVDAGTVLQTMQKGYRLGEQLIRPARVVVAE